ncbi:MAG: cell division protein FtsZ [Pseudomonadota bacterium]
MTLNLQIPEVADLRPRITVFGVGGAGCNAVNNMITKQLEGVEFVVANTDAQALQMNKAPVKIQLGEKATEGLGAGAQPAVGAAAAEESLETIIDHLAGSHMCFITAGMGGGTGTGAAPIIAQAARELGILTVGVITKPFQFEGGKRARQADDGVEELQKMVDTLIIIPNQNLFRIANEKTTFTEAFSMADDVLYQGVKGVTDLMVRPGIINLDFADIRVVMDEMGKAMMGTGEAVGEDRAIQAAEQAINNPLLDEISLDGAKGVLINITGGSDLTLFEVDEAANRIREKVDPDANILVGSALDDKLDGTIRVSVVATGIDASGIELETPIPRRTLKAPLPLREEDIHQEAEVAEVPAAPVEPDPIPEPAVAESPENAEELSMFDVPEFDQNAPEPLPMVAEAAQEPVPEEMPEPMYQHQAVAENIEHLPEPEQIPEPSEATYRRLQQAVEKEPEVDPREALRPAFQAEEPKRGVLGGFISRMTGGQTDDGYHDEDGRAEPSFQDEVEQMSPADEQVEVPAFLRRQAN